MKIKFQRSLPAFEIISSSGIEEMDINFKDILPGIFGQKAKKRKMPVAADTINLDLPIRNEVFSVVNEVLGIFLFPLRRSDSVLHKIYLAISHSFSILGRNTQWAVPYDARSSSIWRMLCSPLSIKVRFVTAPDSLGNYRIKFLIFIKFALQRGGSGYVQRKEWSSCPSRSLSRRSPETRPRSRCGPPREAPAKPPDGPVETGPSPGVSEASETRRDIIFEGRHIDIRKLTHRSSKVDASIFEDQRRKHHTYNSSSNIAHNCAPKSLQLEWTKLHTLIRTRTCIKINNI